MGPLVLDSSSTIGVSIVATVPTVHPTALLAYCYHLPSLSTCYPLSHQFNEARLHLFRGFDYFDGHRLCDLFLALTVALLCSVFAFAFCIVPTHSIVDVNSTTFYHRNRSLYALARPLYL